MFTVRNTIILAVMQVGVIVAGTLGAGICRKMEFLWHVPMPGPTALFYSYGVLGFVIPLTWGTIALVVERNPKFTDDFKNTIFASGILILILLVFFVIPADFIPWLFMMGYQEGGFDN